MGWFVVVLTIVTLLAPVRRHHPTVPVEAAEATPVRGDSTLATLVVMTRAEDTHQPVPFAPFVVLGQGGGATREDGSAVVTALKPGPARVIIHLIGFAPATDSLVLHAGRCDTLGLTMREAIVRGNPDRFPPHGNFVFPTEPSGARAREKVIL